VFSNLSPAEQEAFRPFLSPGLARIVRIIGLENTFRLVDEFGGREISVPMRAEPSHPLARLIGAENVAALNKAILEEGFGDGLRRMGVPKGTNLRREMLRARIRSAVAGGMPKREAARVFSVTTRAVRSMCNSLEDDR